MSQACQKESIMQLTHPEVAQPETGSLTASSLPLFLFGASLWTKVQRRLRRVKWTLLDLDIWLHWFSSLPHLILGFFLQQRNYWRKERRKEIKIPFRFQLYFWVQQPFCGWRNSSWIQWKWLCLPDKVLKYLVFGKSKVSVFILLVLAVLAHKQQWCQATKSNQPCVTY